MASMRDWLQDPEAEKGRVVVVHCKAGKGRSGTAATSYLISEEGWSVKDAMLRFTARRMRSGFGAGISIPSQVRWVGYTDWWTKHGKIYVERPIEILEVHVWGLRDGVKVAIEGFVDEGRKMKAFHTFKRHERTLIDEPPSDSLSPSVEKPTSMDESLALHERQPRQGTNDSITSPSSTTSISKTNSSHEPGAAAALFRPEQPLIVPTSDINVDFERRNRAKYGLTMVTSVAHVWFNAFFESQYALQQSSSNTAASPEEATHALDPTKPPSSGAFSIHWDAMDGIKGSARKGTRALDRLSVVWRAVSSAETAPNLETLSKVITQPQPGEPVPETGRPAVDNSSLLSPPRASDAKNLGLKTEVIHSNDISRANSPVAGEGESVEDDDSEMGVKTHGLDGEEEMPQTDVPKS